MIRISQINYQPSITNLTKMNQSQQLNPQMKNQEPDTVTSPDIGYGNGINFRGVKLTRPNIRIFTEPGLSKITSDAVYTIDPNAHIEAATNVVVGKYVLRKLPDNKLEQLKGKVLKCAQDMGIENFSLPKPENWQANYATQAIDKLMNHEIFNEGNIKENLNHIYNELLTHTDDIEKAFSESMLEFIDVLTAKENKRILKNDDVQNELSRIILPGNKTNVAARKQLIEYLANHSAIMDNKTVQNKLSNLIKSAHEETIDSKIKSMNYLTKYPHIMDKDIDLCRYIQLITPWNERSLINAINRPNPPYNPMEALKK